MQISDRPFQYVVWMRVDPFKVKLVSGIPDCPGRLLPTSPGLILIVFPLTSERAGKNHTHHYGIFGFHPYIVPTHFLQMDTPTARALRSRVVGSIFRTADPPVLVSYVGWPVSEI